MSKDFNGIMYAKGKRIEALEAQKAQLTQELDSVFAQNQILKQTEAQVSRDLISQQNKFEISELDSLMERKNTGILERTSGNLKVEYTKLSETIQEQVSALRGLEQKLKLYQEELADKQVLVHRLSKQSQLNGRMITPSGKVFVEAQRQKKELQRSQRELNTLQNSMAAKTRFLAVLHKKTIGNVKGGAERSQLKSHNVHSVQEVIEDLAQMQTKRLKSFQKLVRQKNAILLKPKNI